MIAAMSDVRALLLTDVVDSTGLSERLGDAAMAEVWAAHDRAARDLLPAWRGREIDKTDGMLLLFATAADAFGYALAYQRALGSLPVPLHARVGLHVGPVILRENSANDVARGAKALEVEGIAKPITARVMALARGGQILLTQAAREALGDAAPPLQSHGHWLLKGLAEPIELFEACIEGVVPAAPPDGDKGYRVVRVGERWLPVARLPNNLPHQPTSFIGRERELAEVKALLDQARLITVLGLGGLGKTRLALQVAAEAMPQFPDGAWFVDLTPIHEPARVVDETARTLGLTEEPGRPLLQTLTATLRERRLLLILDNCEHLIEPCADLVAAVLRAAPQVRILASSREALRVPGEQAYPILPLPLPLPNDSLQVLARSDAVQLFVVRAQAHKPAFTLGEREAPAVAELVSRLEGIPLALELAAARVRAFSVADINARLKDRFGMLTGGGRTLPARQQTLRALIDWSYDLLSGNERCLLERLAVFVGGSDLAAVEAVCGAEPIDAANVADLLGSLTDKSLIMLDETGGRSRYRMLETIREYAREKLDARPDDAAATAERHCHHYFAFAKLGRDGLRTAEPAQWIERLEAERENLRAATALSLARKVDPFIAIKIALALQPFWIQRGYATEGRDVIRAALALPEVQSSEYASAHALYVGAALAQIQGDVAAARDMLETCLQLRRKLDKPVEVAAALSTLALVRLRDGEPAAAAQLEREALQMFVALGNRQGEMIGHQHLGLVARHEGNLGEASAEFEQALTIAREIGDRECEGECELLLGVVGFDAGDHAAAVASFESSLGTCTASGDRNGAANAQRWLGKVALERADLDTARRRLNAALRAFADFEMREEMIDCIEDHALLAHACGRMTHAITLAASASQARERLVLARAPRAEARWKVALAKMREAAGDAAYHAAWAAGTLVEMRQTVQLALGKS